MKKALLFLLLFCVPMVFSACTRVGATDSMDLLHELEHRNVFLTADEFVSEAESTHECGYIGDVRFRLTSDQSGRVERITLTATDASDPSFSSLAKIVTEVYCGFSPGFADTIWTTLQTDAQTGEIRQCRTDYALFSYSADAVGCVFVIDNTLLHPTEAPTVTVRATVPLLKESKSTTG
ncbi:MAG TPA: hypothetical protein DDY98_05030 [Ruminococcaceae bacterium]|nr:hypothetical protein [Oscillospiraceae bacterium]